MRVMAVASNPAYLAAHQTSASTLQMPAASCCLLPAACCCLLLPAAACCCLLGAGDLTPEVFDDACRFRDPTNDVVGLSRYVKASVVCAAGLLWWRGCCVGGAG